MDAPSPRYLITRAIYLIVMLLAAIYGYSFFKKKQRQSAIINELQSITSDSSFFQQFYPEDARKTLIRAIGLIAEAHSLGLEPNETIDRGMGLKPKFFDNELDHKEPPLREKIIRSCLRRNYENYRKLDFKTDFHSLDYMKKGELPPIPSGPQSGRRPEISNMISPEISPGMEKVIANLEIRPPQNEAQKPTDIEIAAAKQLARDLADARLIEEPVRDRILKGLSAQEP
jgi:hypothetical protein